MTTKQDIASIEYRLSTLTELVSALIKDVRELYKILDKEGLIK